LQDLQHLLEGEASRAAICLHPRYERSMPNVLDFSNPIIDSLLGGNV